MKIIELLGKALLGSDFDHGYPHIERVLKWAERIVSTENLPVDRELLKTIVLLHDVGRIIGEPHAYYSGLVAEELLKEFSLDPAVIRRVVNAIQYHSFSYSRNHRIEPGSLEALVLSDADKLDALGIVGFIRVFIYSCRNGRSFEDTLKHFDEKIFKLSGEMKFRYSRLKASELVEKTMRLLNDLLAESRGLCEGQGFLNNHKGC